MAYETKVILRGQADYALVTRNKKMYQYVANQLNVEGVILKPYDEAIKDIESDDG